MPASRPSIRRKLTQAMLLVSAAGLLLTTFAFMAYEISSYKAELTRNLTTLAKVIAANSSGSLAFRDEKDAREVLSALRGEPHIVAASLYDVNGKLFAVYPGNLSPGALPKFPGDYEPRFEGAFVTIFQPVTETSGPLGILYLKSDLKLLQERVRRYAGIAVGVLLASLLAAWLLSTQLQKRISGPILALAQTAKSISEKGDYSARAPKLSEDETGQLTDAFNRMLARVQDSSQALQETAERLRIALEASRTGTWDWNLRTRRMVWDPYLHSLFGLGQQDFGGSFEDLLARSHPEDRPLVQIAFEQAVQQRKDFLVEYRILWPDQSLHRVVSRGRAFYDAEGRPVRVTGVTADVTESRKAEEAERFLAAIVAFSEDAIIGKDLDGKIVSWNAGAEKMFGYNEAELPGNSLDVIIPPDRREEERQALFRVREGQMVQYETLRLRKDGATIDVSISFSPVRNAQGAIIGASAICRDITQRKAAEAEILRLKESLEERVRERTAELASANQELALANQELEAFTSSVAHDLRAPLRHMDAYAQVLKHDFAPHLTDDMRRYLDRIIRGSQNMGRLVDDLLNLARVARQEVKRQVTAIDALVAEVVRDLSEETGQRKIEWHIHDLSFLECDPGLVRQVFANLISNSLKYTRPRAVAMVEIGSFKKNGERVFFVRDNGVGFSMKHAHKLFGIFQRLHRAEDFEGTGVGLATVERIVRKHSGRIWVEAELDKGATFFFTLEPGPGSGQSNLI